MDLCIITYKPKSTFPVQSLLVCDPPLDSYLTFTNQELTSCDQIIKKKKKSDSDGSEAA